MKLYKFILTSMIITVVAVVYVHQRVEIVKAGYDLQKSRRYLACLVDQNSNLMYNLSKLESPRYLLASLNAEDIEFAGKRTGQRDSYRIAHADDNKEDSGESFIRKVINIFKFRTKEDPLH